MSSESEKNYWTKHIFNKNCTKSGESIDYKKIFMIFISVYGFYNFFSVFVLVFFKILILVFIHVNTFASLLFSWVK